jgi:cell division protein FtsX
LLARALSRCKEMATRLALGATRWTLIRQFVLEGLLLAGLGAAVAMLILIWLGNASTEMMPGIVYARADLNLHPDVRVAAFALVSAVLVGFGFTFLPALQVSRLDPFATLKDPGGGPGSRPRQVPLRTLLMVLQVTASLILLCGTGLCLRSIDRQLRIDVGFPAQSIAVAPVHLEQVGFTADASVPVVEELRRKLSQLPGVEAVGIIDSCR